MQPASTALADVLEFGIVPGAASPVRDLVALFEFYEYDTLPGADGFDPNDAAQRFASIEITWLGLAYRRAVLSASDISKIKGREGNKCSVRLSNADENRYVAQWATANQIEGMRLVVRIISQSASVALTDSAVEFVGRCSKPEGFDVIQGTISATADVGDKDVEWPPRSYVADDPEGRSPADPLYEGFPFVMIAGTFTFPMDRNGNWWLWGRRYEATQPYSVMDDTPLGEPIPLVLGRTQVRQPPGVFVDRGRVTDRLDFLCMGPIEAILNFRMLSPPDYLPFFVLIENATYHYGQTGSLNLSDPLWPNHGFFSGTAYVSFQHRYIGTGAFSQINAGHDTAAVILGLKVELPDSSGVFNDYGWTDNGAYLVRHLLTNERFFNIDPAFIEDSACFATGQYNDRPVLDTSNSEQILIPNPDLTAAGDAFLRFRSTGLINTRRARFLLGLDSDRPEILDVSDFDGFDPDDPPMLTVDVMRVRRQFTTNLLLKKRVNGKGVLFNTLLPSFRGFFVWNHKGKIEVRSERPADFAHVRQTASAGATTVSVDDVTPWKAAGGLWGKVLIGTPLTTSEVRKVTSAAYTADANTIPLTGGNTGTVTLTLSGLFLAGGSSSVPATGTATVGGTAAAGSTVTVTIAGLSVTYTLESGDTTATAAYMLAAHINAHTQLRRFVTATASGSVVTITSKWGVLTLTGALANSHASPTANPTAAPSPTASGSGTVLLAGTYRIAYANRTAHGPTYVSPYASLALTAGQQINIPVLAFPAGVTSRDWFVSKAANDSEMVLHTNDTTALGFAITTLPDSTAAFPPEYNTSGEELVRVAQGFASNNQDPDAWVASTAYALNDFVQPTTRNGHRYKATTAGTSGSTEPTWPTTAGGTVASGTVVFTEIGPSRLAQAGLTRGNIFAGTYKWPMSAQQPTYTQVVADYVNAKDDFAPSKIEINDKAQRERLGKVSPKNLDLTAVDNSHQARRLALFDFSKFIDHHWFNTLKSNGLALLLEEGDVICASDDSGGHVNVMTQVEEFTIHLSDFTVSINRARLYSTAMFRELVPKTRPLLPSVLQWTATKPTQWAYIDAPPIRDEDGLTPGFYVVGTYDSSTPGDHRGYTVHADFGDGYRQIAAGDAIGTLGTCTSTLPATSPTRFDESSVLTVELLNGTPTTATREQLLQNPRLNLAAIIDTDGTVEYIQFTQATLLDPVTNEWSFGPGMYRGRFGTGQNVGHLANATFAMMDAALLVPMSFSRVGSLFDLKLVTVNEDVGDAVARTVLWQGGTYREPAPVNAVRRDDSDDNSLIEWDEVTRLQLGIVGGKSGNSDGKLSRFEVDLWDAGRTEIKATFPVVVGDPQPAVIVTDFSGSSKFADVTNGNTLTNTGTSFTPGIRSIRAVSLQRVTASGNRLEATLRTLTTESESTRESILGLIAADAQWYGVDPTVLYGFRLSHDGIAYTLYRIENGVETSLGAYADPRVELVSEGGAMRYYVNRQNETQPIYTSTSVPPYPLRAYAFTRMVSSAVENIMMTTSPDPKLVIMAAQQTEYLGAPAATLELDIYKVSRETGRGVPLQVSLQAS